MMWMMIEEQIEVVRSQGASKALRIVIGKIERFDGKNITSYLRVYACEMEIF